MQLLDWQLHLQLAGWDPGRDDGADRGGCVGFRRANWPERITDTEPTTGCKIAPAGDPHRIPAGFTYSCLHIATGTRSIGEWVRPRTGE